MDKKMLSLLLVLYTGSLLAQTPYTTPKQAIGKKGMVVSAHPAATEAGIKVLKAGGNAIDAAAAVQFALAVVYPRAGNLGGGGFMVLRTKEGETATLDYREKAPVASTKTMFLNAQGEVIKGKSEYGHWAAGVPGSVAGICESHRKYGKLALKEVIQPAIDLAEKGVLLTNAEAEIMNKYNDDFRKINTKPTVFSAPKVWKKGDTLVQKDLAKTLCAIQKKGAKGFYEGKVAQQIIAEIKRGRGIMTLNDLENYQAEWRKPLLGKYKNFDIIAMPPPSSGGVALLQLLGMVEQEPLARYGFQNWQAVQAMVEAERRAYSDRSVHLGDPDFWSVPVEKLLDKHYLSQRFSSFSSGQKADLSKDIQAGVFKESEETTHLSVIDAEGNAVSVTTTLNTNFGSKVVVGEAGFFLNNEMDDFSIKTGVPNHYGLVGGEANAIAPNKRMLSSMTPTIILKDSTLYMILGTPGGSTIITSVFQVFLNVAEFGLPLKQAVHAPRFHHQWLPDKIFVEKEALPKETREKLKTLNYLIEEREPIGRVEAILIENGKVEGVADSRGDDTATAID